MQCSCRLHSPCLYWPHRAKDPQPGGTKSCTQSPLASSFGFPSTTPRTAATSARKSRKTNSKRHSEDRATTAGPQRIDERSAHALLTRERENPSALIRGGFLCHGNYHDKNIVPLTLALDPLKLRTEQISRPCDWWLGRVVVLDSRELRLRLGRIEERHRMAVDD